MHFGVTLRRLTHLPLADVTETATAGRGRGTVTGIEAVTGTWSRSGLQAAEAVTLSRAPFRSRSTPSPTCRTRHATLRSWRSGCSCPSGSTESASLKSWCVTSPLCWLERRALERPLRFMGTHILDDLITSQKQMLHFEQCLCRVESVQVIICCLLLRGISSQLFWNYVNSSVRTSLITLRHICILHIFIMNFWTLQTLCTRHAHLDIQTLMAP